MTPRGKGEPVNSQEKKIPKLGLDTFGTWLIDGEEITHEKSISVFNRTLERRPEGYVVVIGREVKTVEVEDTAYFVRRVSGTPESGFTLSVSDGTEERLKPETIRYKPGRLTARIKNDSEEARFLSSAYWELLRFLEETTDEYFLEIEGQRIKLGSTS